MTYCSTTEFGLKVKFSMQPRSVFDSMTKTTCTLAIQLARSNAHTLSLASCCQLRFDYILLGSKANSLPTPLKVCDDLMELLTDL
jgi:hypothetical protein